MPIYEYKCSGCGHEMEAFQKMSDAALTECPKCHQSALQKLVSSAGFQLKGTGWYATDFKNKGKPEVKKSEGEKDSAEATAPKETAPKETAPPKEDKSSTAGGKTE